MKTKKAPYLYASWKPILKKKGKSQYFEFCIDYYVPVIENIDFQGSPLIEF